MSIAAVVGLRTVHSAEGDCPSADAGSALSDSRMGQTPEFYIDGDDCARWARSSNNHQSSIILYQFQRDDAGTSYYHFDVLGSGIALMDVDGCWGQGLGSTLDT